MFFSNCFPPFFFPLPFFLKVETVSTPKAMTWILRHHPTFLISSATADQCKACVNVYFKKMNTDAIYVGLDNIRVHMLMLCSFLGVKNPLMKQWKRLYSFVISNIVISKGIVTVLHFNE